MKKTTKFLLVLAAVVAMTIGAVSTVMAADDVVIAKWIDNGDKGWAAEDADGKKIMRGWAVADSGIWYYFHNGVMQTNRFVTTNNKTYYVNGEGEMHTGWFEFNKDIKVNVNGAGYDNVAKAFGTEVGSSDGEALKKDTRYATVWCYFNEDGSMVKDNWAQVDGIWYFFDGPFCLIGEWIFDVDASDKVANYGFDASGAMLAGWIAYVDTKKEESGKNTPYYSAKTTSSTSWIYYGKDGKLASAGWLKDADGNWFYTEMTKIKDNVYVPVAMANTYLTVDGKTFYFDDSCYMATGDTTINAGSSEKLVTVKNVTSTGIATGESIKIAKNESLALTFKADGTLVTGISGVEYFEDNKGTKYSISVTVTGGAIEVAAKKEDNKQAGIQWTGSFLYVYTNKDNKTIVNYFSDGEMVKSEAITFGNKILAFDDKGNIVTADTKIDGVKYGVPAENVETLDGVTDTDIKFVVVK